MFDAKRLLGHFIAGQVQNKLGRGHEGFDRRQGGGFGSRRDEGPFGGSLGGSALGDIARTLGGGSGGALAGGLASLLLGSKKGRKLGGSAVKLGGMALVGSLAYRAFQSWQASQEQGGQASRSGGGSFSGTSGAGASRTSFVPGTTGQASFAPLPALATGQAPPEGSPFAPAGEEAQQALSRALLRAMIAAAKADGHIDATEQAAIFGAMDRLDLDADDKAFVVDELRAPLDVDAIARSARSPEEASEIYTASLLAIDVDNPAERAYLALLAARLNLDEGLVAHLHATVEEASRAA